MSKRSMERWVELFLSRGRGRILVVFLIAGLGIGVGSWVLAAPPPMAPQLAICTVNTLGTGSHPTIQDAVSDPACTLVNVAWGTYVENVVITRNVIIRGAGPTGPASTIIDGDLNDQVFSIESVSATVGLASLCVTQGHNGANEYGGGIFNQGTLALYDVMIVDNHAPDTRGGGIYNAGVLTLTSSVVDFNWASSGGGIYNDSSATATIVDSQISGHGDTWSGGGIYSCGTLTIIGSEVRNNSSADRFGFQGTGGGIRVAGGRATIEDSIIHSNYSDTGAGIYIGGEATIENSHILSNTAGGINAEPHCCLGRGGGILIGASGQLTLTHSTVRNNRSTGYWSNQYGDGGGVYLMDGAQLIMVDTDVISNTTDGIAVSTIGIYTDTTNVEIYASTVGDNDRDGILAGKSNDVLYIRNSQISDNGESGIYSNGPLTLIQSLVSNNGFGGIDGSNTVVRYSTIRDNVRNSGAPVQNTGGGIHTDGYLKVIFSTVSGNTSGACGGGISADLAGTVEVRSSTVNGNTSGTDGGGICIDRFSYLTMVNSTVSGNTADGDGGGVALLGDASTASLDSVTIADNTADQENDGTGDGGGMYRASSTGAFSVTNSIVATNLDASQLAVSKDPDCHGDFYASGLNLIGAYDGSHCTGFGWALQLTGSENAPLDPLLSPLADNGGPALTHAPDPASPAVDYEFIASCPDVDQRGVDRPQGAYCDLGAVEIGTCPAPVPCTLSIARDGNDLTLSWTESDDNREYVFYRTTDPFDPSANLITMTTPFLNYTDYGAVGDPQMNYFYRVAGENACGERSDLSNKVGEFDFGITPGVKRIRLTMIALPLEGADLPTTADGVAEYIDPEGSIRAVAKWRPQTRSWMVRRVGAPFGTPDFPVAPGDTLFVGADSAAPESFAWVGDVPPRRAITHTLYANGVNFVMVPLARSGHYVPTALGLADDIGGVTAVARWNQNTQRWVIRTASVGTNFDVYPGYPYAVLTDNSAPPSWP